MLRKITNFPYRLTWGAFITLFATMEAVIKDNTSDLLLLLPLFSIFSFTWISVTSQLKDEKTRNKTNDIFLKSSMAYFIFLVIIPFLTKQLPFYEDKDFQKLVFYLSIGFILLSYGAGEIVFRKTKSRFEDKPEGVIENVSK